MKIGYILFTKNINPELYKKIYPVFCLVLFDADRNNDTKNKDGYFTEQLLNPLRERANLEKYTFSLLQNKRDIFCNHKDANHTIFTLIRNANLGPYKKTESLALYNKEYLKQRFKVYKRTEKYLKDPKTDKTSIFKKKEECDKYIEYIQGGKQYIRDILYKKELKSTTLLNMYDPFARSLFVEFLRKETSKSETDFKNKAARQKSQKVLENNLNVLKEIIQIGQECGMATPDPAPFLFF